MYIFWLIPMHSCAVNIQFSQGNAATDLRRRWKILFQLFVVHLRMLQWKNCSQRNWFTFAKVILKIICAHFFYGPQCIVALTARYKVNSANTVIAFYWSKVDFQQCLQQMEFIAHNMAAPQCHKQYSILSHKTPCCVKEKMTASLIRYLCMLQCN